ncbi:MAG: anti-sigma factor domain-containing protein [Sulfobacillus sp.]
MTPDVRQQRAVVVEIQGRRAVVMTKDGRFLKVRHQNYRLGEETWVSVPQEAYAPALRWGTAIAAAALVVAVMSRALPGAYAATVAYVSVQINPGVTLGVTSNGTVTSVQAQDHDAATVLSHMNLVGDSLPQAVTAIIQGTVQAGLVGQGHWIAYVVTVYPATGQAVGINLRDKVAEAEAAGQKTLSAAHVADSHEVLAVSAKVAAQAKAHGVGVGTYVVYLQLQAASQAPLTLSTLAGQGLTQGIIRSGDQTEFEQETQGAGGSTPRSGTTGKGKGESGSGGPSQENGLPSGVEDLLPTVVPGSGGSSGAAESGQGQNAAGDTSQQSGSGKSKGDGQPNSGSGQGSSDNSGGAFTLPQLPSADGGNGPVPGGSLQNSASDGTTTGTQSGTDGGSSSGN